MVLISNPANNISRYLMYQSNVAILEYWEEIRDPLPSGPIPSIVKESLKSVARYELARNENYEDSIRASPLVGD